MDVDEAIVVEAGDATIFSEDYSGEIPDNHEAQSGTWEVLDGALQVTPAGESVLTFSGTDPLPSDFELSVTFNANNASSGYLSNALVVFDYESSTDFKFAGAYFGADNWIIGHCSGSDWVIDTRVSAPLDALTDYDFRLTIVDDSIVTIYSDGVAQLTHSFDEVLSDGQLGFATKNSITRYDNLEVRELIRDGSSSPAESPLLEDFDDGNADHFDAVLGTWLLVDGTYQVTPVIGGVGISLLNLSHGLSEDTEISVTINSDSLLENRFSNSVVIFDYQSETDFKYAGAFTGRDVWAIGHRTADGWHDLAVANSALESDTDLNITVKIEAGNSVSLFNGETEITSHTFDESLIDGSVGLGTNNSVVQFDDFQLVEHEFVSDVAVDVRGNDLIIGGFSSGEVKVVATSDGIFEVYDQGRLVFTSDSVKGDLLIELDDGSDQLILDLSGQTFSRNVSVNLGGGDNSLTVENGAIDGHLIVESGDGQDSILIADNVSVGKHVRVDSGGGDDRVDVLATIDRALFLATADGSDRVTFAGDAQFGFIDDGGDSTDQTASLSSSYLVRKARAMLQEDSDSSFVQTAWDGQRAIKFRKIYDQCDHQSEGKREWYGRSKDLLADAPTSKKCR